MPIAWVGLLISLSCSSSPPASVHTALAFSPADVNLRTDSCGLGRAPWGVPIILDMFPLVARIEKADMIFHLVFFIAFTFVVTQETAIPLLTRVLKIEASPSKGLNSRLPLDPRETDKSMW